MAYTTEQKEIIDDLKLKVAKCQKQYALWRKWCEKTGNDELWRVIEPAIVAKGIYYKAEIVRAKHNIARFMLGRDQDPAPYPGFWIEELDKALTSAPWRIQELTHDKKEVERTEGWGVFGECYQLNYQLGCELFEIFLSNFKEITNWGKRRTYGGSV